MNILKSQNEIAKYISSQLDMKLPRKGHHYEAYISKAPKEDIRASNKKIYSTQCTTREELQNRDCLGNLLGLKPDITFPTRHKTLKQRRSNVD